MSDDIRLKIRYEPLQDIEVFELAQCVKWYMVGVVEKDKWPDGEVWTRHFKTEDFDYGAMIDENARKLKEIFEEREE